MSKSRKSLNQLLQEVMQIGVVSNIAIEDAKALCKTYNEPYREDCVMMQFVPYNTDYYESIQQQTKDIGAFLRLVLLSKD